ncbi:flagellar biosynthesis protein FlhA [bacterium BMS3Bbin03]|nr:flagellar biosynthesis protein FlhA [bacterium BMS3Bbin03]
MMAAELTHPNLIQRIFRQSDIVLSIGVIGILIIMIMPLPTGLLDLFLVINITISLTVLMVSMYLKEPVEFSVFPGLLLVMTLYRLSLNIASTRLILGDAYAGKVISAFGNFVVKGNYIVGFVIFFILVVIQFVVITKGAGRIAEVAARFTLDAMPGKQMAIDADLNAGLIDDAEARSRRLKISQEADFYGAMDGASKFVRGDAIAGLIITSINIFGGFVIGVLQKGMSLGGAVHTYTLLTVGDGLVSQIPALILSVSAGIVVTRAASEENLGHDISRQLLGTPRGLYVISGALLLFGIMPGMPMIPFFALAGITFAVARAAKSLKQHETLEESMAEEKEVADTGENVEQYLQVDPLEIEIGYGLIPLVDEEQGGDLLNRITTIRKQLAIELGVIIPPIRIRDNIKLKPDEYIVKIRGADVAKGEIVTSRLLALVAEENPANLDGIPTKDPAFGLPAYWIPKQLKEKAESTGFTVVEPEAVLATHLKEILKSNATLILSRQDVHELIENVKKEFPTVIEELIPNLLNIGQIQKVLQNLLREQVPIRDMVTILETLADYAGATKDPDILTEYVRNALSKTIYKNYLAEDERMYGMMLDPQLENTLIENLSQNKGSGLNLPPDMLKALFQQIKQGTEKLTQEGYTPLVLASPIIRSSFKRLIEVAFPQVAVLSYNEIPADVEIQTTGVISYHYEN